MEDIDSLLDSLMQRSTLGANYITDNITTIKIKPSPTSGQGLFAEEFLSMQKAIYSMSLPSMIAIDSDSIPTTCYHCLVTAHPLLPLKPLKTCAKCNFARFCSRDCQIASWPYHKYECKIFAKTKPAATFRAVMRAVLLKDRNLITDDEWNQIINLTAHEPGDQIIASMAESIKLVTASPLPISTIRKLILIMKYNATELPTPIYGSVGVMLEPLVAKFNHSCKPNISFHRPQSTMTTGWDHSQPFLQVIPLRDIQPGEELFNCYVVPTLSVEERKKKLSEYLFDCTCPKCTLDMAAATNLAKEQPNLESRYKNWVADVLRNLSQIPNGPRYFTNAGQAMSKSSQFLTYPALYSSGDFPQMALAMVKEGLKLQAFDEALVNLLRLQFLVNPERFVGRHNPTNLYTGFLLLDVFDAVLGLTEIGAEKRNAWMSQLSDKGMKRKALVYWRRRLVADMRKRLEEGAQTDLLVLVEEKERMDTGSDQQRKEEIDNPGSGQKEEGQEEAMEKAMGTILGLTASRWTQVLQTSRC